MTKPYSEDLRMRVVAAKFMITNLHAIGQRLYKMHFGQANLAPREVIAELLGAAAMATGGSLAFLRLSPL